MITARLVFGLAALSFAAGCTVEHARAGGTVTIQWTVDSATDPSLCTQSDAAQFDFTVYDSGGHTVGDFRADCQAFAMTVPLPPGDYSADARLLDASNVDRTTTITVNPFSIHGDTDLNIGVDFPAASFE